MAGKHRTLQTRSATPVSNHLHAFHKDGLISIAALLHRLLGGPEHAQPDQAVILFPQSQFRGTCKTRLQAQQFRFDLLYVQPARGSSGQGCGKRTAMGDGKMGRGAYISAAGKGMILIEKGSAMGIISNAPGCGQDC